MKKYLSMLLVLTMFFSLAACGTSAPPASTDSQPEETTPPSQTNEPAAQPNSSETPAEGGGKTLIAYFSATGNTENIANHLDAILDADLYEIIPQEPYTSADLNYNSSNSRAEQEINDPDARPAISGQVDNMEDYDVIFLGYPIWWGQASKVVYTFLESYA